MLRPLIALGLLVSSTWLFIEPGFGKQVLSPRSDAVPWLWLVLAGGLGFILRSGWAFLLAPLPRLLSLWYNVQAEHSIFVAEGWPAIIAVVTAIGLLGIALGWTLRVEWERQREQRVL